MRFKVLSDYIEINDLYTFKCATNLVDGNEVTYTSSYVDKIYVCIAIFRTFSSSSSKHLTMISIKLG